MDASQITKLIQKQNTRFINRSQTLDSSTLIWKNQIQSSKYIKSIETCEGDKNSNVPTNNSCLNTDGICSFGGSGRTSSIQSGSTKQYLNVLSGSSGSASQVYSSESILLQKVGKQTCSVIGTFPHPDNAYVILPGGNPLTSNDSLQTPSCNYICSNTNGPTINNESVPVNNQLNPYLPPFDTFYDMKNPTCKYPKQDENQKHFVKECHSRFPNANNGVNVLCKPCDNTMNYDPVTKQFHTDIGLNNTVNPDTCDGCILE